MKRWCTAVLLAGATMLQLLRPAAAAETLRCIDDWSHAARIVKQEQLATIEDLANAAKRKLDGVIVRTALCREGGRYVYRLVVRDRRGLLSRKSVDARKPF